MYKQLQVHQLRDLLEQRELELLAKLDATAKSKFHCDDGCSGPSSCGPLMVQVCAMEENLQAVIQRLREEKPSMKRFMESYPKWRENRKECIVRLGKIAKSLDKDRRNFNYSKLFGYCLSFAGGAALVASGASIRFDADLATTLAAAGGAMAVTGGVTVLGLSITETVRLARKVKKAKKLIKEDEAYFRGISDWLSHATELQEALINILDIGILKIVAESTKKLVRKALKIKSDHKRLKFIEKIGKSLIDTQGLDSPEVPAAAVVAFVKVFATVMVLLCKVENRLVFDFASVACSSVAVVTSLVENSIDAFGITSMLAAESVGVARVALGVVGMALDAVGIVKISIDIHKKSRSPEGKQITQAARYMSDEADNLENIYKRLSIQENILRFKSEN